VLVILRCIPSSDFSPIVGLLRSLAARTGQFVKPPSGRVSLPSRDWISGGLRRSHPYNPEKWLTWHDRHGSIGSGGQLLLLTFQGLILRKLARFLMVQRLIWLGLVGVLVIAGEARVYAQERAPSKAALSEMGLSGLTVMSDDDAMNVRGEGFKSDGSSASAWGSSFAFVSTPFGAAASTNGYNAHGKHSANGDNLSFAGAVVSISTSKDHDKPPMNGGGYGGMGDKGNKGSKGSSGMGSYGGGNKGGSGMGGNGGYGGGNKGGNGKGGNGGYGGGNKGGNGMGGNGGYGGGGNKGGSKTTTISVVVFAGGSSHAHAH
jgi:hypothetical protein